MTGSWSPFGRTNLPEPAPPAAPAPAAPTAAALPREPARRLAVLTCMDSRVDPIRELGLARGDAMILRNAGAQVSDDVERSLRLAEKLGVREVWLMAHSDCAAHGSSDDAALAELRRGAARLRKALPSVSVQLLFYDFATGVSAPAEPPG
ncbi:MAG TPA: carbonic anhydrase [Solirubrobacteraceae bacterium]|nr:carbonic anhydrase [Solirubrobacteraceae bacterium]